MVSARRGGLGSGNSSVSSTSASAMRQQPDPLPEAIFHGLPKRCRLLNLQGDLGFKMRDPENELCELVGYRSQVALFHLTQ